MPQAKPYSTRTNTTLKHLSQPQEPLGVADLQAILQVQDLGQEAPLLAGIYDTPPPVESPIEPPIILDPQDLAEIVALNNELPSHLVYTPNPPQETEAEFFAKQAERRLSFAKQKVKVTADARLEAKLAAKSASSVAVSTLAAEVRQANLGNISSLEELDLKEALLKTYIDLVESFQMNLEAPLNHKATALTSRTSILKAIYAIKHKLDAQERVTIQEGVLIETLEELDPELKQKFLRVYRQRLEQAEKTKKRGAYGS